MSVATLTAAPITPVANSVGEVDNRATYLSFGLAYVLGHGLTGIARSADPLLELPGWLPMTVLATVLERSRLAARR
jgi:hypothetical protein